RKHYSLILMLDVLEHLDRPEAALRHAGTLLEQGGVLLITVPAFRLLWTNHDVLNQHRTRFTKAGLRNLLERVRLRVLDSKYFFIWLFAAKLCARVIEGMIRSKPVVPRVFLLFGLISYCGSFQGQRPVLRFAFLFQSVVLYSCW